MQAQLACRAGSRESFCLAIGARPTPLAGLTPLASGLPAGASFQGHAQPVSAFCRFLASQRARSSQTASKQASTLQHGAAACPAPDACTCLAAAAEGGCPAERGGDARHERPRPQEARAARAPGASQVRGGAGGCASGGCPVHDGHPGGGGSGSGGPCVSLPSRPGSVESNNTWVALSSCVTLRTVQSALRPGIVWQALLRSCRCWQHPQLMPVPCCWRRGVTLEYQRQQAKAMQKYFRSRKQEKTVDEGRCVAFFFLFFLSWMRREWLSVLRATCTGRSL